MNWLRRMMMGRYGTDQLSLALIAGYFVLYFLSYIPYCRFLSWIGLLIFAVVLFRTKNWFRNLKVRFHDRKTHRYYKCKNCGQKLRVPKGRGKIKITCPKCHNQFIKKTQPVYRNFFTQSFFSQLLLMQKQSTPPKRILPC